MSRGYEVRDVDFRPVLWATLVVSVVVVIFFGLMWLMYAAFVDREGERSAPAHALSAEYGRKQPPLPRLQDDPLADWQELQAKNREILTTYGWVDREAGAVRIPIDRAMELILERGFQMRSDRGLRGDPDPRFEAYMRRQQAGEPEPAAEQPRRKREREREREGR